MQFPKKKVTFSFTTNGTLFTLEIIEYIKSKQIGVTIGLDGSTIIQNNNRRFKDGRDTFDSVIKGMQLLNQNDIKFTVIKVPSYLTMREAVTRGLTRYLLKEERFYLSIVLKRFYEKRYEEM